MHGVFELGFRHLPVSHAHAGCGHECAHVFRNALQPLHTVVYPKHLSLALNLALQHFAQHRIIASQHSRCHWFAVLRGSFDDRQLAYARHGELQGARNGRGREREHVHVFFQRLELFLVAHTKALLFVQNEQGQIGQLYIA